MLRWVTPLLLVALLGCDDEDILGSETDGGGGRVAEGANDGGDAPAAGDATTDRGPTPDVTGPMDDLGPETPPHPPPDGARDSAGDAGADAVPDAGRSDAAQPVPELPAACLARATVLHYGKLVLTDDAGLHIADPVAGVADAAPPIFAWDAGFVPHGPVGAAGDPGSPELFVALVGEHCRVRAFSNDGQLAWVTDLEAQSCTRPALSDRFVVVATADPTGGRLHLLGRADGRVVAADALPDQPTTPPVRVSGAQNNGGSHWLVGIGARLAGLGWSADALPVIELRGLHALSEGRVADLVPADAGLVVAAVRIGEGVGPGDHLLRVEAFEDEGALAFAERGEPIATPGEVLAPVVAARDCASPFANGGSHWWCPGGVMVGAGEGWLEVYDLDSGDVVSGERPDGLRITGVALTKDGRAFNGGSHWRGGDSRWVLRSFDATVGASVELGTGDGAAESCVGSPVVDTDGRLATQIEAPLAGTVVVALETLAGGLSPAWARIGGDNLQSGSVVAPDAPCAGGDTALFARPLSALPGANVRAVAPMPEEGAVVLGTLETAPDVFAPWAARLDRYGYVRWQRTYPHAQDEEIAIEAAVAVGEQVVAVHGTLDDQGRQAVRAIRIEADGELGWDRTLRAGVDRRPEGVVARAGGGFAVLTQFEEPAPNDVSHAILVLGDDGLGQMDIPLDVPGDPSPEDFVATPDGGYVVVGHTSLVGGELPVGYVLAMDGGGVERWRDLQDLEGTEAIATVVALGDEGEVWTAGLLFQPEGEARTGFARRYSRDGALRSSASLGDVKPVDMVVAPGHGALVLTESFSGLRLTAGGALASTIDYRAPEVPALAAGLVATGDRGALLTGITMVDPRGVLGPYLVRHDAWGIDSCGGAGLCVTLAPDACDADELCSVGVCSPDGICVAAPLEEGSACGAGLVCGPDGCGP